MRKKFKQLQSIMIKRIVMSLTLCLTLATGIAKISTDPAKVYFTSEISPESLLSIFRSLGVKPEGKVAVKNKHRRIGTEQPAEAGANRESCRRCKRHSG